MRRQPSIWEDIGYLLLAAFLFFVGFILSCL